MIDWYHTTLCHPGINQTEETIGQHLWWPKMRTHITNYEQICPLCQRNKRQQKKYGLLPPKLAEATPWDMCQFKSALTESEEKELKINYAGVSL
jgi:hypothetical protein